MIKAEVIQSSTRQGVRIDTFVLEYPRIVHAEFMTHRVFSRNASSTRAVPLTKAIEQIKANPAKYIWTENQAGMQGKLAEPDSVSDAENLHALAMADAIHYVEKHAENGIHKQNAGRYLEPFQNIKVIMTTTELENFFWLRDDKDAQGEIAELARVMKKAYDAVEPMELNPDEWHVPYIERERINGVLRYFKPCGEEVDLDTAKMISTTACAQVSYRALDLSQEKVNRVYGLLIGSGKIHASAFEHCATPIPYSETAAGYFNFSEGVTHIDRNKIPWSGNFRGWVQYRQLIKGHDKAKY